jgi:hypothetical protein
LKPAANYSAPDVATLLSPSEQRRHHRIATYVDQEQKFARKLARLQAHRRQLMVKTHPHGVIGVDSPLDNQSLVYGAHHCAKVCPPCWWFFVSFHEL